MKNYGPILGELLRTVETEDKKGPDEMGKTFRSTTTQASVRDAICQILASGPEKRREEYFAQHPDLKDYYPHRINPT